MKRLLACLLLVSVTACYASVDSRPTVEASSTSTVFIPTLNNKPAPTETPPSTQTPTQSATLSSPTPPPCDPSLADYCIVDGSFVLQRPIAEPGQDKIDPTYPYGSTQVNTRTPHRGVEFYNASGTPVLAVIDGVVFYAGDDKTTPFSPWTNFYGNLIVLEHTLPDQKIYMLYAHLSKVNVVTGQAVGVGEKIGEVGASGAAIGSHLHFEVRLDPQDYTSTLNPELWLIPHPDNGVLAMQFVDADGLFVHPNPNIQYYPDPNGTFTAAYQPEIYAEEMNQGDNWENAVLGDLPTGRYRLSYMWHGVLYERWIEIKSGKLTQVEIVIE